MTQAVYTYHSHIAVLLDDLSDLLELRLQVVLPDVLDAIFWPCCCWHAASPPVRRKSGPWVNMVKGGVQLDDR